MKRIPLLLITAAAALSLGAATVSSVSVRGADGDGSDYGDVLARCGTKAGAEYDSGQCARDVRALRDTGEYDDITVEANRGEKGVDVVFVVRRKRRFQGPLNVKGNEYWNAGKIAKLAELKDGYTYGEADYAAAANKVVREYQKKYFPDVKVTPVVEPVPGADGVVSVTFDIVEGERKKISKFVFEGAESLDHDELREAFGDYPWWNPLGWFTDTPTSEQDFAEARDKVRGVYRDKGYLDAEVSMPEEVAQDDGKYYRVFRVKEGALYKVGKMSVTGVTKYPESAALAAIKNIKTGDVAGAAALAEAARKVEIFCGSGEHPLAETHVEVRRIPSGEDGFDNVVDLVFDVKEGVPVTLNRVIVRGNDYTKDKVIRREIRLSPGDPMLEDKAEQSKRRLENLRYFERVRYYLERVEGEKPRAPGESELRDLVYEVTEKNTGNFMVGIGASSVDSVYGTVELSESNFDLFNPWRFRGGGQKGLIRVEAGPRVQTYLASVTEPWLFDRQLELTVDVYRRGRWFDMYDLYRSGASATLSYPVKFWPTWQAFGRFGARVSAEYIEFDDVEKDRFYNPKTGRSDWQAFKEEEEKYGDKWEVPFRIFWADDTRDSFLFAKKGHKINIYGELVAADNEYWHVGFNYRQYLTVWKKYSHVVSFGLRAETLDTFGGSDKLPIYDRLFLGGPRSIRGVEYRDIAPRVWKRAGKKGSYEPWGGQTSWCMNIEYTVPIVKMVRVAVFTDLGSVGEDEFDFDTDMFCWSVGVGLRLDLEQFPIRLDFATPIKEPDDDCDKEVFSFTVGYDF